MSEVETASTGFRRGGKQRSSLPVVRTPSKTLERPLGKLDMFFLFSIIQYMWYSSRWRFPPLRFSIPAVPDRNEAGSAAQRDHINWHCARPVRALISASADHALSGGTERKDLYTRCQQGYVLRVGRRSVRFQFNLLYITYSNYWVQSGNEHQSETIEKIFYFVNICVVNEWTFHFLLELRCLSTEDLKEKLDGKLIHSVLHHNQNAFTWNSRPVCASFVWVKRGGSPASVARWRWRSAAVALQWWQLGPGSGAE